jgi:hypothetical protein
MKLQQITPGTKVIAKRSFIILIIAINIINISWCIVWMPGTERLTSFFYKYDSKEQGLAAEITRILNYRAADCSIVLAVLSLFLLLVWQNKYFWYAVTGLLTFFGMLIQGYIYPPLPN